MVEVIPDGTIADFALPLVKHGRASRRNGAARALDGAPRYPTLGEARFSHTKPLLWHGYGTEIGQRSCDVHAVLPRRGTKNQ